MMPMDEKCPKCGGAMNHGEIKFDTDAVMPNQMNAYMGGMMNSPVPNVYSSSSSHPYWEEKTGRKTGFILKSDEKKTYRIKALRCTLCGYVEMYANDKRDED
jgi:predicted nucleic-acid-binding Zn-ribbon protein